MHGNEIRDRIATLLDSQDEILKGAKGDRLAQRDAAQYDRNDAEIRQLERDLLTAPGQDTYGQDPIKPGTAARGYSDGRENRLGHWLASELRGWVGTGTTDGGSFTPTDFGVTSGTSWRRRASLSSPDSPRFAPTITTS